jgi:hypothetical protein
MMTDIDQAAKAMRDEEMLQQIEDFLEGFNQPTYRGMRINGQRVATWARVVWGQQAGCGVATVIRLLHVHGLFGEIVKSATAYIAV